MELSRTSLSAAVFLSLFFLAGTGARAQSDLPPPVESQIAPGVQALKSGDLDTAEKVFSEALRHGVKHPLIFHNLGIIAQQQGNHLRAIADLREAILLQPNYGPSHLLMGSSLMALKRNAEAVRELKRAVDLMPEQPVAHLQLAKAYEASENWVASVQELQKLVALAPQEPEYSYQVGKAWMNLSAWCYQRMAHLNKDSARLHQALAQEYAIQEKYDLALATYQQAARSDPKLPEIHLAMALILFELKRPKEALAEANLELDLVPESKAAAEAKAKIETAVSGVSP
jgi:tetratricopeptide (TPR) repeat protein